MKSLGFTGDEVLKGKYILDLGDDGDFEVSDVKVDGNLLSFIGVDDNGDKYWFSVNVDCDSLLEDIEGLTAGKALSYPWDECQFSRIYDTVEAIIKEEK